MGFTVIIHKIIYFVYSLATVVLNKETHENHVGEDGGFKNIKCPILSVF